MASMFTQPISRVLHALFCTQRQSRRCFIIVMSEVINYLFVFPTPISTRKAHACWESSCCLKTKPIIECTKHFVYNIFFFFHLPLRLGLASPSRSQVNKAVLIGPLWFHILHFMKFIFYFQVYRVMVFVNEKEWEYWRLFIDTFPNA